MIQPEVLGQLSPQRRQDILKRSMEDISGVLEDVRRTVNDVRDRGDAVSVEHYAKYKDDITVADIVAKPEETEAAYKQVPTDVVDYLKFAADNIRRFHQAQLDRPMWAVEVLPGVQAGRLVRPMDVVGCYVPGRQASYPSSVLMTILPAKVAGVAKTVVCTPPDKGMVANATTLVAADLAGADHVFKIGGPWAVASMAYGTATVPKVHKIVGPGNRYVTAAKMVVFGEVDIDSPAGPSEILILADESADAHLLALDFISQIEHDPDAAAVLVTTSTELAGAVCVEIERTVAECPRRELIEPALKNNSAVLLAANLTEAVDFTNDYAAEHLEIVTRDPVGVLPRIKHAGSIFLGPHAPVPVGDYATGTNHVLPTGQCAKMFSGLSVDDFITRPTYQYLTPEGLRQVGPAVVRLAEAEGLPMHARAVRERLERNSATE